MTQARSGIVSRRWPKAVLFRLAAILIGLSPFLVVELGLRAFGLGKPELQDDPFIGFSNIRPLFELNDAQDRYQIAASRRSHFVEDSFPVQKSPDEFRVFCIGDSTVQGNPWSTETSFTTWLEISLQAADPTRQWNVINCGGISYASYRMVPILQEVIRYEPDLVILHCSHNEFLEDRTYGDLKRTHPVTAQLQELAIHSRLFNVIRSHVGENAPLTVTTQSIADADAGKTQDDRTVLPLEVRALLDQRGGLEHYHRDAVWQRSVIAHYELSLRRMVALARASDVPLWLMNPACQLRDTPPFKAEHRADLTASHRQQCEEWWAKARQFYATQPATAVSLLRNGLTIDDQHAGLHYDLAKCYDALGQFDEARAEYIKAKELDVCPLRILESMNELILRIGRETRTPVVDLRRLFEQLSRNGIPSAEWFADHVHPTIPGYQRIADELADELVRQSMVYPRQEWQAKKELDYAAHLDALPPMYFVSAQRRLRSLMLWAHGRVSQFEM